MCGWEPSLAAEAGSEATLPEAASILVNIDKSKQRMTVFVDGVKRYHWPVSTGAPGYSTPSGTYTASSMNEIWYSKQWDNAPMPHAVFFTKEGHAIHGTNEVRRLGKPASHGCVRLSPQNAATLYALVEENGLENTQVVLVGLTPVVRARLRGKALARSRVRCDPNLVIEQNCTSSPSDAEACLGGAGGASVARQFSRTDRNGSPLPALWRKSCRAISHSSSVLPRIWCFYGCLSLGSRIRHCRGSQVDA